jgi:lysyl-tRNA synthetase class 2
VSDQIEQRRIKLQTLRDEGVDPFPRQFADRSTIASLLKQVDQEPPPEIAVAGRIMARRDFGKMVFVDLMDESGRLQVMVRKDDTGPEVHKLVRRQVDEGDFLGVHGTLGRSKKGEPTVFARTAELLSKSLRPLPEKWHGLTDVELRYRYRYVDLFANAEVREVFALRSRMIRDLRHLLEDRGFLEVETPLLHPIAGGAAARPFTTHHNALDLPLYLRIAPELYLKRLLVGGFEQVFEVGRVFRNEGISTRHNPEFTMLELYWAYQDYNAVMDLTEDLLIELARRFCTDSTTTLGETKISLCGPFARRNYHDLVREFAAVDPEDEAAVAQAARDRDLEVDGLSPVQVLGELFEEVVEPQLIEPTFVTLYPTPLSPLAKPSPEKPELAERFELFIHGWEIANAFSELNDPEEQRRRFERQVASRDPEAPAEVDSDYLRALEHGMPPAAGLGIGVDRLMMVLSGSLSIRDTILFPLRRPTSRSESDAEAAGEVSENQDETGS